MKIGSLQKVSLIDYPGKISATVFAQGCNFACPYCHNPELVDPGSYGNCLPDEEVLSYLEKRKGKLEAVTITGGEPSLQPDLLSFAKDVKALGYLIKLDTNGSRPETLYQLLSEKLLDYIAMDIKAPLSKYKAVTRAPVSSGTIRKSIEMIMSSGIGYEFRTTVVASLLNVADLLTIGRLIKNAPLYVMQRYVPSKPLDKNFLHETTLSTEEFAAARKALAGKIGAVAIR